MNQEVQELAVAELVPSPFNPRKGFSKDSLADLADSIKAQGVLQPLLVRAVNGHHEIVAGERRWRAAKAAGLKAVPCIVQTIGDEHARELQIIENLQRQDITALEEAAGFQSLLKLRGDGDMTKKPTVKELAEAVGKSQEYVYARLKLLGLAAPVQKMLAAGKIEPSHAVELAALKPEQQNETLEWIKDELEYGLGVSVQSLREQVKRDYGPKPAPPKISAKEKALRAREAQLQKKRQAAYQRQAAKSQLEQKRLKLVNAQAFAQLWPKLKAADAKSREKFVDLLIDVTAASNRGTAEAILVAEGKPIPDGYIRFSKMEKKFAKRPRGERLALVILSEVIDRDYNRHDKVSEQIFRWAKIDRKAIDRELQRKEASAAKSAVKAKTAKKK